jgi:hypothetical protein
MECLMGKEVGVVVKARCVKGQEAAGWQTQQQEHRSHWASAQPCCDSGCPQHKQAQADRADKWCMLDGTDGRPPADKHTLQERTRCYTTLLAPLLQVLRAASTGLILKPHPPRSLPVSLGQPTHMRHLNVSGHDGYMRAVDEWEGVGEGAGGRLI